MSNLLNKILQKISYSSTLFWDTHLNYTPDKIFEKKVAAELHFKNKLTKEEHLIELDVEEYQLYMEDKSAVEDYYLVTLRESRDKANNKE